MSLFAVGQSKMKALLTGGTGFVGQNLKNHLLAKGWVVENISRTDSSRAALDLVMARFRPDVVIHLATLFIAEHKPSDIPALIESNITFGTQVVDSMAQHQVLNLVNAGTLWQYYEGQREVPACLYAATKTAFESVLNILFFGPQTPCDQSYVIRHLRPKGSATKTAPQTHQHRRDKCANSTFCRRTSRCMDLYERCCCCL